MKETDLLQLIRMRLSEKGCLIWRNNVGKLQDKNGRWITYGVCNPGGSDLIGIAPGGKFLALEIKTGTGRVRPEQESFVNAVQRAGGIAGIARSVEEAEKILCG